uniref:Nuclear receptor subfamily 2 group E member 1 n=1 Tax=Timema genevievae TaxID=629358 RepID=A0A7R9K584_TIMGE|nr:unnamed protein product [Timema genevievae]
MIPVIPGRILYDIPCKVCQDHSSGKHYGIFACDGCAGFFKRSIRRQRQYVCKAKSEGSCMVDKTHRNQCRACRLNKCLEAGMNKDAVQHERGPRNSTLRRQMALYFKEPGSPSSSPLGDLSSGLRSHPPVLDLALPKVTSTSSHNHPRNEHHPPHHLLPPPGIATATFLCAPGQAPKVRKVCSQDVPPIEDREEQGEFPCHPLLETNTFGIPDLDSNLDLPITGSLVYYESSALDHVATEFPLGFPLPTPFSLHTTEAVCESAARLLFMNVKWAKNVPAFTNLHFKDQLMLLESSWRELFVLGAAQFLLPMELGPLIASCGALSDSERALALLQEVKVFQDTIDKFRAMTVDPHEYACLRAIVLFKTAFNGSSSPVSSTSGPSCPSSSPTSTTTTTGDAKTLRDVLAVAALQDHTQLTLNKYISTAHPGQPFRFGKLLLLLPCLRAVSNGTIEELFFRRTIGNIPIERIICDMYTASDL